MQRLRGWLSQQSQHRREERDLLTRKIAHRLYLNRVARGREGNEKTDWAKAEKIVRRPLTRTAFRLGEWWRDRVEAFESTWLEAAMEGLDNDLQNLAIIDLLGVLASLSLISGAIGYFGEAGERRKQTNYQAWQVINLAVGRTAESGRKDAIEDLWGNEVSLSGLDIRDARIPELDLSAHCYFWHVRVLSWMCGGKQLPGFSEKGADLERANLQGAELKKANFERAKLGQANLKGAKLQDTRFGEADLAGANFEGADLKKAGFEKAKLGQANLKRAKLWDARFGEADLAGANFEGADLKKAGFEKARLWGATLKNVKLWGVNFEGADLWQANFEGTVLWPNTFKGALLCETILPKESSLDPDRDCQQ
ncbi:MAG: pentapeptide repeat-containing protein [Spirulina sp.]